MPTAPAGSAGRRGIASFAVFTAGSVAAMVALAAVPFVVFAWVCWGLRLAGFDAPHATRLSARWVWLLLGAILAHWALRNVPDWTWLSPA